MSIPIGREANVLQAFHLGVRTIPSGRDGLGFWGFIKYLAEMKLQCVQIIALDLDNSKHSDVGSICNI